MALPSSTSDPKGSIVGSQGTPPFKLSDILNVGDWFGNAPDGKGAKRSSAITDGVDAMGSAAMSYAMAAKTGNNTLQKKAAKGDAIFDAAAGAAKFIPGIGTALSLGMQGLQLGMQYAAPKLKKLELNNEIGASSAFGGLGASIADQSGDINAYNAAGVSKFFMGKNNIQSKTDELAKQQKMGVGILRNNTKVMAAAGNNAGYLNTRNQINMMGGVPTVPVGKSGLNTSFLIEYRKFKALKTPIEIQSLQKGGPINVIVDGKLHKELNHMADVVDVDITRKGIPVIALEEKGGAIEQAAELERDEVILHLQLTKKLEELAKENTDESMVKAGKLLAKEILRNTRDSKSKLLKTVE
jgi:hypothetical protein